MLKCDQCILINDTFREKDRRNIELQVLYGPSTKKFLKINV